MPRLGIDLDHLEKSVNVLFSAASFSTAWDLLCYGCLVDIFFSPMSRQAFFTTASRKRIDEYIENGCIYIASIEFIIDQDILSRSEARILIKQNLVNLIRSNQFYPIGQDNEFMRVFI